MKCTLGYTSTYSIHHTHLSPSNFKVKISKNHVVYMWNSPLRYCHPRLSPIDWFRFMVFNATFNNISVISCQFYWWRKPEYPEKKPRPVVSYWQTLSHNMAWPKRCWYNEGVQQYTLLVFYPFNDLRKEVVVRFVDVSGILDHDRLDFLFMSSQSIIY